MLRMCLFLILVALLLVASVPVLAQEATATPAPVEETPVDDVPVVDDVPITDLDTAANLLTGSVVTILQGLVAAPLTVFIVGYLKQINALRRFTSQQLALATAAVIWISGTIATTLGYQAYFTSVFDFLTRFAGVWQQNLLPLFAGVFATLTAAHATYQASKGKIAVAGAQRDAFPRRN